MLLHTRTHTHNYSKHTCFEIGLEFSLGNTHTHHTHISPASPPPPVLHYKQNYSWEREKGVNSHIFLRACGTGVFKSFSIEVCLSVRSDIACRSEAILELTLLYNLSTIA